VAGKGEPVVLVHGWSASAEMWNSLMGDLARDHQVIAMDCRGHGRSDKPHEAGRYRIEMANDVVRLMDHLGLARAHVVGYSMGGSIALRMLIDHPDRFLTAVIGGSTGFRAGMDEWDAGLTVTDAPLKANRVPALVIYGSRDDPDRFARFEQVLAAAQFTAVEGAGHGAVPDSPVFVKAVLDFLTRHQGGR